MSVLDLCTVQRWATTDHSVSDVSKASARDEESAALQTLATAVLQEREAKGGEKDMWLSIPPAQSAAQMGSARTRDDVSASIMVIDAVTVCGPPRS